ncbi:MAG: hypothetical protein V7672_00725 [Brevundimonas sp.]
MAHLFDAFVNLSLTRQVGMAPNPISYTEIEAFNRLTHASLSAWDIALIRRLDLAVMAILNPSKAPKTVSARDGKGVLALIREKAKPKEAK